MHSRESLTMSVIPNILNTGRMAYPSYAAVEWEPADGEDFAD